MTATQAGGKLPNYWEYLRIEELLSLQGGLENDESAISHHETLFIVVHQVYELWFKLVLRELGHARDLLHRVPVPDPDLSRLVGSLTRVNVVLGQAVSHFEVMETLSPRDFLDFREKLFPASGFQSAQMRELELMMGLADEDRISLGADGGYLRALESGDGTPSPARAQVERRKAEVSNLREVVEDWLHRTPIRGSGPNDPGDAEVLDAFVNDYLAAYRDMLGDLDDLAARHAPDVERRAGIVASYEKSIEGIRIFLTGADVADQGEEARARRSRIRAALVFIESYRELPLLAWPRAVLDALIALEQNVTIFRQRHARMVEREIGRRVGTGGSAGVEYLDQTALAYRVFSDLWAVRTILIPKSDCPPLEQSEFYDFRFHV